MSIKNGMDAGTITNEWINLEDISFKASDVSAITLDRTENYNLDKEKEPEIEFTPEQKLERRKIIDKMTADMKASKFLPRILSKP